MMENKAEGERGKGENTGKCKQFLRFITISTPADSLRASPTLSALRSDFGSLAHSHVSFSGF